MATTIRSSQHRVPTPHPARLAGDHALPVSGSIPAELDGCLLQAAPHPARTVEPAWHSAAQGPLRSQGVRLAGGTAGWHRQDAQEQEAVWRAARVWAGGEGPDEVGATAVARPVQDPGSSLWHTVATYPGLGHAEHLRLSPDGEVWHAEPFALSGAPLMHAVATTGRFLVVFDLPVTYRRAAALVGARFPYAWQDGRPARIGLLGRGGGQPRWFEVRPGYVFNAVNAYEDGEQVVVDVVRHERAFDPTACPVPPPTLWRWVLDLTDGSVREIRLGEVPVELPAIDPRVRGARHRYVYGTRVEGHGEDRSATALVRHDLLTGTTRIRPLEPGRTAGQPVFVPRRDTGGTPAEGDGWLLTVVDDPARGRSDLLILDAADLAGPAVATVHLPVRLPGSLHTHWQPAAR
jgi:8'-apo-carotenoid 13,14-cleaving dioxygenase